MKKLIFNKKNIEFFAFLVLLSVIFFSINSVSFSGMPTMEIPSGGNARSSNLETEPSLPSFRPCVDEDGNAKESDLDLDDRDFDVEPDSDAPSASPELGKIDGPGKQDGNYASENPQHFYMGTGNDGNTRSTDLTMNIDENGNLDVSGSVDGAEVDSIDSEVTGSGTKKDPYKSEFTDKDGNSHSLEWYC